MRKDRARTSVSLVAWLALVVTAAPTRVAAQARDTTTTKAEDRQKALRTLLSSHSFGVPRSPAFELLSEKPGEVVHVGSSGDLQSVVSMFLSGTTIRTGAALDGRPFGGMAESLTEYQQSLGRQALFRTVLALGTAPVESGGSDVVVSAGLRIPIIDRGDLRARPAAIEALEEAFATALAETPPGTFPVTLEARRAQFEAASERADAIRDSLALSWWNALKVDVGVAGALLTRSGSVAADSIETHRAALWAGAALPVSRRSQLTLSVKSTLMSADSATDESSRYSAGARLRFFASPRLALSLESARIWSRYDGMSESNESWTHVVGFVEVNVPVIDGWIGVAYGGDTSRRDAPGSKLSIQYAFYRDRILKRE